MVKYYGRRVSSDTDSGLTGSGSNNQLGQIGVAMPEDGWATAVGVLGGKNLGEPNLTWRGAIFDVSGSTIDDRLIYTGPVTVSNAMSFGGDGAWISGSLTSFQLHAGVKYARVFAVTGGVFRYGMKQAALSPGDVADYYFHKKSVGTSTPTDPFGASSVTHEGAMDTWIAYEPNVAPTITNGTMVPSGTVADNSPAFFGDWDDGNESEGDTPNQYKIQLRQVGTTSLKWNQTYGFSASEKTAKRFSRSYEGSALSAGVSYEWRYQVSDQFDEWSDWSSWETFTVPASGSVSVAAGTPTGKQETQTPGPFTGVWSSGGGLSTNAVELRIYPQGASKLTAPLRISGTIAKTVANGGTISISWADSGFSALAWGTLGVYSIRARDTLNVWSEWSSDRAFTVNAAPSIPANHLPVSGAIVTARPLLRVQSSDSDDTTASGFSVSARIKNAAGTLLFTRTMTFNSGTGYWEYQTTPTDLASFAVYKWDARATDGTVTTAYSAEQTFNYAQGPVLTVVAPTPAQVLVTDTPTFSFTQDSTQVWYQADLYSVTDGVLSLIDTTGQVTEAKSAGAGSSYTPASGLLHNQGSYAIIFSSNNGTLTGTSDAVYFSLDYPDLAAPAGASISPVLVGNDVTPSSLFMTWELPPYSQDNFLGAYIYRREVGQSGLGILLDILEQADQTFFYDHYPQSGVNYVYTLMFGVLQGTDTTQTLPVELEGRVDLDQVVINDAEDGSIRVGLRYGDPYTLDYQEDIAEVPVWGQAKPHQFVGELDFRIFTGAFDLQNDRQSAGRDDLLDFQALRARKGTVCVRTYHQAGLKMFGKMTAKETLGSRDAVAKLNVTVRENDHREGILEAT